MLKQTHLIPGLASLTKITSAAKNIENLTL